MSPPPPGRLRLAIERRSAPLLAALTRQPPWLLPVLSALLLAGVVFLSAAGGLVCLLAVLALVGWLSYLSWPAVDGRGRTVRLASLVLLLAGGLSVVLR